MFSESINCPLVLLPGTYQNLLKEGITMNNLSKIFAVGLFSLASLGAHALPSGNGSVSFSDNNDPDYAWTRIDSDSGSFEFGAGPNGNVDSTEGSYTGFFPTTTDVTFFDFSYSTGYSTSQLIWESNGISFTLDFITVVDDRPAFGDVTLLGRGTLEDIVGPGLGDTLNVDVSLKFIGETGTWLAKTSTIPEPAPLALLGVGLIGIALARRKQKA